MKDKWFMYYKFYHYLKRFISVFISDLFQYFIAKLDPEIIYWEAIAQAACKKLAERVVWKKNVIIFWDVYVEVIRKVETEVKKTRKILKWAKKAELKKKKCRDSCL